MMSLHMELSRSMSPDARVFRLSRLRQEASLCLRMRHWFVRGSSITVPPWQRNPSSRIPNYNLAAKKSPSPPISHMHIVVTMVNPRRENRWMFRIVKKLCIRPRSYVSAQVRSHSAETVLRVIRQTEDREPPNRHGRTRMPMISADSSLYCLQCCITGKFTVILVAL
ncbi:hypothetical protein Tco_1403849 [Tanacetum coccineum]